VKVIWITGCFGFIGSSLFDALSIQNKVFGVGRNTHKSNDANKIVADISFDALNKLFYISGPPDVVIHCAGTGSVMVSQDNPIKDKKDTVDSVDTVLSWIIQRKLSPIFCFLSSAAVYGVNGNKCETNTSVSPISIYGENKLNAENLCQNYSKRYKLKINILRLFSVYGEGLRKQIFWDSCNRYYKRESAVFFGDGNEIRDWIHIDDVSSCVIKIISHRRKNEGLLFFNVATGKPATVQSLVNKLAIALDFGGAVSFNKIKSELNPAILYSDSLTYIDTNNFISLDEGVKKYVAWYLRHEI
jgi:UDP-glucose 4-epimerase